MHQKYWEAHIQPIFDYSGSQPFASGVPLMGTQKILVLQNMTSGDEFRKAVMDYEKSKYYDVVQKRLNFSIEVHKIFHGGESGEVHERRHVIM
jgi:hypothetical protein